jgi:hypothetical protein
MRPETEAQRVARASSFRAEAFQLERTSAEWGPRGSGPAGATPETAAAAGCEGAEGPLGERFGHGQRGAISVSIEGDEPRPAPAQGFWIFLAALKCVTFCEIDHERGYQSA